MFTLDTIVPWGRSFDEYCRMFALTDRELGARIVGCGDGPASFNAEATRRGRRVTSADPLYELDSAGIQARVTATFDEMLDKTRRNAAEFVWDAIGSVDELGQVRMRAMRTFLADYDQGRGEGRDVNAALPSLPFDDGAFDLALCSHFLFLYRAQLDQPFHLAAMREMCSRAAKT